jgi:hypothetical protein
MDSVARKITQGYLERKKKSISLLTISQISFGMPQIFAKFTSEFGGG